MSAAAIFFSMLTVFAAGAGLTAILWRKSEAILAAELFGLSWMLGAAVISAALALGGVVFSSQILLVLVTAISMALAVSGIRRLKTGFHIQAGIGEVAGWERWAGFLAVLPIVYMASTTYRDAISWDGLFIWESKARFAFLSGGSLPLAYFSDTTRIGDHLNYPLYLPFTELWVYLWVGDCDQTALKPLFPMFYAAGVALLWSSAFRLSGRHWIAAVTAFIPLFIPFMADHGLGLMQGYADFILGSAYLAAVGALLAWRLKKVESGWFVACVCGAMLPWIKQEGVLLLGSLLFQAGLMLGWRQWRRFLLFCLPGVATVVSWKFALQCVHVAQKTDFDAVTLPTLWARLPRLSQILPFMAVQLSMPMKWSVLWYLVPAGLACLAWQRRREALYLGFAIFAPLSADIVPFMFTHLDFVFHMGASMDRLILQLSPLAVLALGLALEGNRAPLKRLE